MSKKILVAGVGNIFLGDDGFGVEVARRLTGEKMPAGVRVADFGIRGVHLAYELLEGYDTTILVDAAPRGERPGTVYVIEVDVDDPGSGVPSERAGEEGALVDAHGMEPDAVFGLLRALGAAPAGCSSSAASRPRSPNAWGSASPSPGRWTKRSAWSASSCGTSSGRRPRPAPPVRSKTRRGGDEDASSPDHRRRAGRVGETGRAVAAGLGPVPEDAGDVT